MTLPLLSNFFSEESLSELSFINPTQPVWVALSELRHFFDDFDSYEIRSELPQQVALKQSDQIYIGKNVTIAPFSYIQGPCYIEDGATIGHGALVRPYTYIARDAQLGHCSEIKNSILFSEAKAPHFNYVGDSLVGCRVNLGAGVILTNFRLDKSEISVRWKEKRMSTKLNKFGSVIGDDCSVGSNVVLNPGTLLTPKARITPCPLSS